MSAKAMRQPILCTDYIDGAMLDKPVLQGAGVFQLRQGVGIVSSDDERAIDARIDAANALFVRHDGA